MVRILTCQNGNRTYCKSGKTRTPKTACRGPTLPLLELLCHVVQLPTSSFACLFHLMKLETKNSKIWFNVRFFCKPIIYLDMISSLATENEGNRTYIEIRANSSTPAMACRAEPKKISQKNIRVIHKSIVKVFSRLSFVCFHFPKYCTRSCTRSDRSSEGGSALVVQR